MMVSVHHEFAGKVLMGNLPPSWSEVQGHIAMLTAPSYVHDHL